MFRRLIPVPASLALVGALGFFSNAHGREFFGDVSVSGSGRESPSGFVLKVSPRKILGNAWVDGEAFRLRGTRIHSRFRARIFSKRKRVGTLRGNFQADRLIARGFLRRPPSERVRLSMRTVAPSGSQLPSAFEFQFSGADDLRSIQPDLARPDNLRVRIRVASEILYEIDFRDGEKTVLTVSGVESKLYESGTFIAAISVSIPRYPDKFGRQTEEASGKIELSLMISDFHPSYLPPDELNGSGTARLFVRGLKWGIVTYTDLDRTISLDR